MRSILLVLVFESNVFQSHSTTASYDGAQETCRAQGGYLPTVETIENFRTAKAVAGDDEKDLVNEFLRNGCFFGFNAARFRYPAHVDWPQT
jgi:hypothetical protein